MRNGITKYYGSYGSVAHTPISASVLKSFGPEVYREPVKEAVHAEIDAKMNRFFFKLDPKKGEILKRDTTEAIDNGEHDNLIVPNASTKQVAKQIIYIHDDPLPSITFCLGMKN